MASREQECENIDFNIRSLTREVHDVIDNLSDIQTQGERLTARLENLRSERSSLVASGTLPARAAARTALGGPIGMGLTVVDAIAKARQLASLDSEISQVRFKRDNLRNEWQRLDRQRSNKLDLIRQSQAGFIANDCFELGFSHEVLNMP